MLPFHQINHTDILFFIGICGDENVTITKENLTQYGSDETENLCYPPDVVLFPTTEFQISDIVKYCNQNSIAVTPRGAGTGLSGGALPVYGGVCISMKYFNSIIKIDEQNLQVIVQPGVITEVLQNAVKAKGLFYPPDPASKGSCFIGGNIAENSGGPKAVKYGVVKDYVLNLEIVLPTGEIIWTGANVLKNATGFNLTQLIVGSEGLLGIVTKIVLKLIPHPTNTLLMLAPFPSAERACEAVAKIFQAGITPSAMEFMERDAIDFGLKYLDNINIEIKENTQAHLLIEVDGFNVDVLMSECEKISDVLTEMGCDDILFAESEQQKNDLWRLRRGVAEAVKSNSIYKEEDTVVPRAALPKLLNAAKKIGTKYNFKSVCYGHAGDGNLHVNILKENMSDELWENILPIAIRELFEEVKLLGGTLSGEHGIGLVQKEYMDIVFSETQLELMKKIKHVFDPNGIMNPGKVFKN
jgi:glycolate oxidase